LAAANYRFGRRVRAPVFTEIRARRGDGRAITTAFSRNPYFLSEPDLFRSYCLMTDFFQERPKPMTIRMTKIRPITAIKMSRHGQT
jgi:hypothetical protein